VDYLRSLRLRHRGTGPTPAGDTASPADAQLGVTLDPESRDNLGHKFTNVDVFARRAADRLESLQRSVDQERSASAGLEGGPLEEPLGRAIQAERNNGHPLEPQLRKEAEQVTGAALSAVRVHTSTTSAAPNEQIGARAFTAGRDIFLDESALPTDREVMFHEITHTVQQGMGEQMPGWVGAADTPYESAAASTMEESGKAARLVQRLSLSESSDGADDDQPLRGCDISFDMPLPEPRDLTVDEILQYAPDYQPPPQEDIPPTSGPNVAMALRTPAIQRDGPDGQPHLAIDLGVSYPWSIQTTLVFRNLNLRTFTDNFATLDLLHEPQLTLSQDSLGALTGARIALGILNLHLSMLREETEIQLLAQLNAQLGSVPGLSLGPNVELEQPSGRALARHSASAGPGHRRRVAVPATGTPRRTKG